MDSTFQMNIFKNTANLIDIHEFNENSDTHHKVLVLILFVCLKGDTRVDVTVLCLVTHHHTGDILCEF